LQKQANPMVKRFWILGAGQFGRIAVERILHAIPSAELTLVDQSSIPENIRRVQVVRGEGVRWLFKVLRQDSAVDMIVPAIPVHVVYEWLILRLRAEGYDTVATEIPDSFLRQVPHPVQGVAGQVYLSHADFICPDNCPEPKNQCTVTGKNRPGDLFRLLREIEVGDLLPLVVRSRQILPGVGGIRPGDFFGILADARKNVDSPLFVATACRCHGVGNAVRLLKK
jgi:hypothetical protein